MNPELADMINLQGDIRVKLMGFGIDPSKALDIACEMTDLIIESPITKESYKEAYRNLNSNEGGN